MENFRHLAFGLQQDVLECSGCARCLNTRKRDVSDHIAQVRDIAACPLPIEDLHKLSASQSLKKSLTSKRILAPSCLHFPVDRSCSKLFLSLSGERRSSKRRTRSVTIGRRNGRSSEHRRGMILSESIDVDVLTQVKRVLQRLRETTPLIRTIRINIVCSTSER